MVVVVGGGGEGELTKKGLNKRRLLQSASTVVFEGLQRGRHDKRAFGKS